MKPLPVLTPCDARWSELPAVPGGRHCASCDRTVYELATLTETRLHALATLHGRAGFCARQVLDPDGELVLAAPRRLPAPPPPLALAALALAVGASPALADDPTCAPTTTSPTEGAPAANVAAAEAAAEKPAMVVVVQTGGVGGGGMMDRPTFQIRSAAVQAQDAVLLDEVAAVMRDHPEITRVLVEGHASQDEDSRKDPRGVSMGQRRADAVRDALVARGVDPARLETTSKGTELPRDDNGTADGRAHNRRVEFVVVKAEGP